MFGGIYMNVALLESGNAFRSKLFDIARTLVQLAEESQKPNAARLREYSEAGLESLKQELLSDAPVYDDLETLKLGDKLIVFPLTSAYIPKESLGSTSRASKIIGSVEFGDLPARTFRTAINCEPCLSDLGVGLPDARAGGPFRGNCAGAEMICPSCLPLPPLTDC
jgi:hypothetical protein